MRGRHRVADAGRGTRPACSGGCGHPPTAFDAVSPLSSPFTDPTGTQHAGVLGGWLDQRCASPARWQLTQAPHAGRNWARTGETVSYTHLRAHETDSYLV